MVTITYEHQLVYPDTGNGKFPMLQVLVRAPGQETLMIDVDAYLDSGAELSLFDGRIARGIGLDVFSGKPKNLVTVGGQVIEARMLPVRLLHDRLGIFEMQVGFTLGPISRNLLGRDFFDLIQVGFREHQLSLYISPTP